MLKPIPDHASYFATEDGRILHLAECGKWTTLREVVTPSRHHDVRIGDKTYPVHRLVYSAFFGRLRIGFEVHHLDGDPQNNYVTNLIAVTHSDHEKLHGRFDWNKYGKSSRPAHTASSGSR